MNIKKEDVVLFLLLINVIVAVTSNYFDPDSVHTGIVRALLMFAAFPLLIGGIQVTRPTVMVFICLAYLAILVPFSSDVFRSLNTYGKVFVSLMMFPLAHSYLRTASSHRKLAWVTLISLGILIGNFFAAQAFGLGTSIYLEDGLRAGGGGAQQTYLIAYFIIFLPILYRFRNAKKVGKIEIALGIMALFPLALIGRRGAIVGFVMGFLVFLLLTPRKGPAIMAVALTLFVGVVTMPLYYHHFEVVTVQRFEHGIERGEDQGRFQEFVWGYNLMKERGVSHAMFGSELYNYMGISGGRRPLHTDYASYWIGAGLVGVLLYFGILPLIIFLFLNRLREIKDGFQRRELMSVVGGLFVAYFIISFTGQYSIISSLVTILVIFGAIIGYTERIASEQFEKTVRELKSRVGAESMLNEKLGFNK